MRIPEEIEELIEELEISSDEGLLKDIEDSHVCSVKYLWPTKSKDL